jgi:hypothetical protein
MSVPKSDLTTAEHARSPSADGWNGCTWRKAPHDEMNLARHRPGTRAYLHRGASAVPRLLERVEMRVGQGSSTRVSPGIAGPARLRAAARRPVCSSHLYHHLAGRVCLSLAFCPPPLSSSFLASAVLTLADLIVPAALARARWATRLRRHTRAARAPLPRSVSRLRSLALPVHSRCTTPGLVNATTIEQVRGPAPSAPPRSADVQSRRSGTRSTRRSCPAHAAEPVHAQLAAPQLAVRGRGLWPMLVPSSEADSHSRIVMYSM